MNPFVPAQKPKVKSYSNDSILEALRGMGSGVTNAVTHDVVEKGITDAWASILGSTPKQSGELRENQAINFNKEEPEAHNPFRRIETPHQSRSDIEHMRVSQELSAVRQELKALTESMKALNQDIQKAVEEVPVNAGVYHVNFLERLKGILKMLKEQIDDSRSWLNLTSGRKQKKQYWGMYKKHGTQFGLSSERTMATQTG